MCGGSGLTRYKRLQVKQAKNAPEKSKGTEAESKEQGFPIKKTSFDQLMDRMLILDRSIFEYKFIFAKNLQGKGLMLEMGSISSGEWDQYNKEFKGLKGALADIDLFILLKCELQENIARIRKRDRSYDESKDVGYLVSLEQKYLQFQKFVKQQVPSCRVLEIDTTCMTPVEVLHVLENYIFSKFIEGDTSGKPSEPSKNLRIKCYIYRVKRPIIIQFYLKIIQKIAPK